jgi:hypothetical protein
MESKEMNYIEVENDGSLVIQLSSDHFARVKKLIERDQKRRDYARNYARKGKGITEEEGRGPRLDPIRFKILK